MDVLREVQIQNGKLLISEMKPLVGLRSAIELALGIKWDKSCFNVHRKLSNICLGYSIPNEIIFHLTSVGVILREINSLSKSLISFSCICGNCSFVFKQSIQNESSLISKSCCCSSLYCTSDASECPSPGCSEFLKSLSNKYNVKWESLNWMFALSEDIIAGSLLENKYSISKFQFLNLSQGNYKNCIPICKIEKISPFYSNHSNLPNTIKWTLYSCKVCETPIVGFDESYESLAVLVNNAKRGNSFECLPEQLDNNLLNQIKGTGRSRQISKV